MEEEGLVWLRGAVAPSSLFRRRQRRHLLHAPLLFFIRLDADSTCHGPPSAYFWRIALFFV